MQKRSIFFFLFVLLLLISAIMYAFTRNSQVLPGGLLGGFFSPVRANIVRLINFRKGDNEEKLREENMKLQKEIRDQKKLEADAKALRDQFETEKIRTATLLPSHIIGMRSFIPGVSLPESIILDKGSDDSVQVGKIVVYKDNVIGKITKVSRTTSLVDLLYHQKSTISAKTLKTNALGLISGQGQGVMQLQGVVLSEKLELGDQVLTKGDAAGEIAEYPPDLVIGKIVSVDKRPSALFQVAEVESFINIAKLTMVFIMLDSDE